MDEGLAHEGGEFVGLVEEAVFEGVEVGAMIIFIVMKGILELRVNSIHIN